MVKKRNWKIGCWETFGHKKRQATYITLLRLSTLAVFPPWGIPKELVV